jgi:GT2 family glycosyltransferase
MSVPWSFLPPTDDLVEAGWLPGCGMMWRTTVLRKVGFGEMFDGYAQGEDLDVSLRARRHGRLVIAGKAQLLHLFDEGGRPDHGKLGYMAIYNRYHIQRRGLDGRTWRDVAWFIYAWGLDTVMLLRNVPVPARTRGTLLQIGGRIRATWDLLKGR